jgi:purine-binding chemotaxis protein CheW
MMKDKEKKKIKKAKKAKKTVTPAKKKQVGAKSAKTVKKKKASSTGKKKPVAEKPNKRASRAKRQAAATPEADGKVSARAGMKPLEPEDRPSRAFISDGVEEVIINEDGTVIFPLLDKAERPLKDNEYMLFSFAGEGFALKVSEVHEVLRHQSVTRVPRSADHVIGATSLRGTIIPVVSLGSLLSLADRELPDKGRILILKGSGIALGLLVDKGIGMMSFAPESIMPPMSGMDSEGASFTQGVLDVEGEYFTVLKPDAITRTKASGRLNETEA